MKARMNFASVLALAGFLLVAGAFSTQALAEGTETLGPPGIPIASGSGIVVAGIGLADGQPGTISIDVPGAVQQALLYWEGANRSTGEVTAFDTILVNGTPVTGDFIGGNTEYVPNWVTVSYRADITGLVFPGLNDLEIDGLDYTVVNNGAGALVIYDDGTSAAIDVRDGNDYAFRSLPNNTEPLRITEPQTFNFAPAAVDRVAQLDLFVGSVSDDTASLGFRPSSIEVTVDGTVTLFSDLLNSTDGRYWDTVHTEVKVPAGASSLTVQILSRIDSGEPVNCGVKGGPCPASLVWVTAGLTVAPEEEECQLAVEKFCSVPPPPPSGGDDCDGKVIEAVFEYTAEACANPLANPQDGKAKCTDVAPLTNSVSVVYTGKDPSKITVSPTSGGIGTLFSVEATGRDELHADTPLEIRGPGLLQELKIHTSCSQPLSVGDVFGSLRLVELTTTNGGTVTLPEPSEPDLAERCEVVGAPLTTCPTKPKGLVLRYVGGPCDESLNHQEKDECSGQALPTEPVSIVITKDADKVSATPSAGIMVGDLVKILTSEDRLGSETKFEVRGGSTKQTLNIHTSCSDVLLVGDQFGGMLLEQIIPEGDTVPSLGEVIYTYLISHDSAGPVVVDAVDNKLGEIADDLLVPAGETVEITVPTILTETTTNVVEVLDTGQVCAKASDEVTVEVVEPPKSCENSEKPTALTFRYTGEDCDPTRDNLQEGKFSCNGDPNFAEPVTIKIMKDADKYTLQPSMVDVDGTFTMARTKVTDDFESETKLEIRTQDGKTTLQALTIHTSCSKALAEGDRFGSLIVEDYIPKQ